MRTRLHDADTCPRVVDGVIVHAGKPTSVVHVDNDTFVAVDCLGKPGGTITFYCFVHQERVTWEDLSDEQRLLVRMAIRRYAGGMLNLHSRYDPGEYNDEGYYALEALNDL